MGSDPVIGSYSSNPKPLTNLGLNANPVLRNMQESQSHDFSEIPIHDYEQRMRRIRNNLEKMSQGEIVLDFLNKLELYGLADGRLIVYGQKSPVLLRLFEKRNISIKDATKKDCENIMSDILHAKVTKGKTKGKPYSGESKMAFAVH